MNVTIIPIFLFLLSSALAQQGFSERQNQILADVHDRIDSLDQAGLYVLLENIAATGRQEPFDIDPKLLLADPAAYRGQRFSYSALVYRRSNPLNVSRKISSDQKNLCYMVAKIPYNNDLAYPAIIILPQPPKQAVDRMTIRGYFYMVLRAKTQKNAGDSGPAMLDYLVFVGDRLLPCNPETTGNNKNITGIPVGSYGLIGLGVLWVWLRWKTKKKSSKDRNKSFIREK